MKDKLSKSTALRNNEYYFSQELFDFLYKRSKSGYNFYSLINYIESPKNNMLAFRNIKSNKGSKTNGLSGKNITYIAKMKLITKLKITKKCIGNYTPAKIRRVGIPKQNGKTRYLGIKEPWDKNIEQAIYQILEPILTAKFHNNSNGFIKGRSCKRTIAQLNNYITKEKLYFVIDLDIKGFFDNVNHGKLLKQLWTSGIRDKNLLSLISKMLKAEVLNVGIPDKGTPQGGILSPLLANLVLNELDWWLDSKSNKGIRFVRYADDVRILCPTYSIARNMMDKITEWLRKRLKLEVSAEKTKIVNLKRNYTEFLGCKIKVRTIKNKVKITSHMRDKAIKNCEQTAKKKIRMINKFKSDKKKCEKQIDLYNSFVRGIHNYYDMNTNISRDLNHINKVISKYIQKNLSNVLTFSDKVIKDDSITTNYSNGRVIPYIRGKPVIPIGRICHSVPKVRIHDCRNYFDESSRKYFHDRLDIKNLFVLERFMNNPLYNESVELNDNIHSKFCGQLGKYAITNKIILNINKDNIVRIIQNGSDKYDNILIVENKVKKLIEFRGVDDIIELSNLKRGLTYEQLDKINKIRKENSLLPI